MPDRAPQNHAWIRPAMERAGVSQRDIARAWKVSESGVSRWMDGLQKTDAPASRIVALAGLLRLPVTEVLRRLGYEVPPEERAAPGLTVTIHVALRPDDVDRVEKLVNEINGLRAKLP